MLVGIHSFGSLWTRRDNRADATGNRRDRILQHDRCFDRQHCAPSILPVWSRAAEWMLGIPARERGPDAESSLRN